MKKKLLQQNIIPNSLRKIEEFVDNKDTRLNTVGKKKKTKINVPQIGEVVSQEGKRRQITQAPPVNSMVNVNIATRKGIKKK